MPIYVTTQCDTCGAIYAAPPNDALAQQLRERGSYDCDCGGQASHQHAQEHARMRLTLIALRRSSRADSVRMPLMRKLLKQTADACTYALTGQWVADADAIDTTAEEVAS